MIRISFLKRLLVFLGFKLYVVANEQGYYYITLHKKDKVMAIIDGKYDFRFLVTGFYKHFNNFKDAA